MTSCPYSEKLSAYHDGELEVSDRDEVARHLEGCVDCRQELHELEGLSRLLISAPARHIPPEALGRLHEVGLDEVGEGRGAIRLVRALTAAAAVILVFSCWHLAHRWSDHPRPGFDPAPMAQPAAGKPNGAQPRATTEVSRLVYQETQEQAVEPHAMHRDVSNSSVKP